MAGNGIASFEGIRARLPGIQQVCTSARPIYVARAPGRLDLMGGNDDYSGGLVFEMTIAEATWAAAQARDDERVVLVNPQMAEQGWQDRIEVALAELMDEAHVRTLVNADPGVRWSAYVLGCFHFLLRRMPDRVTHGATVYLRSEVPLNKGVSSSAAVEVATMKAAARAYGVEMSGIELAEACQWVENVIAESACGIMDQMASVLGDEGCVLPMLCQPAIVEPLVRLPDALQCWAVDSGVSHAVTGIEYEAARAGAFMGYKMICDRECLPVTLDESGQIPRWTDPRWNGYLCNVSPSLFRAKFESLLPERMTGAEYLAAALAHVDPFTPMRPDATYLVRACSRYAVEENHRVHLFAELARGAAETGSERAYRLMGDLMYQSHYAYTECGLGNEATDLLVDLVGAQGADCGLFGAKITGGGAGGTVAVLGLKSAGDAFRRAVARYAEALGFEPYVFEGSSAGADRFGIVELPGQMTKD